MLDWCPDMADNLCNRAMLHLPSKTHNNSITFAFWASNWIISDWQFASKFFLDNMQTPRACPSRDLNPEPQQCEADVLTMMSLCCQEKTKTNETTQNESCYATAVLPCAAIGQSVFSRSKRSLEPCISQLCGNKSSFKPMRMFTEVWGLARCQRSWSEPMCLKTVKHNLRASSETTTERSSDNNRSWKSIQNHQYSPSPILGGHNGLFFFFFFLQRIRGRKVVLEIGETSFSQSRLYVLPGIKEDDEWAVYLPSLQDPVMKSTRFNACLFRRESEDVLTWATSALMRTHSHTHIRTHTRVCAKHMFTQSAWTCTHFKTCRWLCREVLLIH